jgi:hypothetical protein
MKLVPEFEYLIEIYRLESEFKYEWKYYEDIAVGTTTGSIVCTNSYNMNKTPEQSKLEVRERILQWVG